MKALFLLLLLALNFFSSAAAREMILTAVNGQTISLSSYRGQWVVVNYWATWCPPCLDELPELQGFHDDHVDKGALVIGLNSEMIDESRLNDFLETYFISFPIFAVGPNPKSELGDVSGLPTTFLVNPEGEVVFRHVGPIPRQMLEESIQHSH